MCEITITTTYEKDHVANKITELPHSIIDCKLTWNNDIFGRPKQSFALTSAELEARLISIGANSVWISVIGGNMAIDGNYPYLVLFIKLGKDNVDNPFDQSTADKLAVRLTEADGQILQKAEEMMAEKEMMAEVEMMAEKEMMAEEETEAEEAKKAMIWKEMAEEETEAKTEEETTQFPWLIIVIIVVGIAMFLAGLFLLFIAAVIILLIIRAVRKRKSRIISPNIV